LGRKRGQGSNVDLKRGNLGEGKLGPLKERNIKTGVSMCLDMWLPKSKRAKGEAIWGSHGGPWKVIGIEGGRC